LPSFQGKAEASASRRARAGTPSWAGPPRRRPASAAWSDLVHPADSEGIETPLALRRLHALGCEFGQGHLFSPARSAQDTAALLARWEPDEVVALLRAA
jgi:hypothetical protein